MCWETNTIDNNTTKCANKPSKQPNAQPATGNPKPNRGLSEDLVIKIIKRSTISTDPHSKRDKINTRKPGDKNKKGTGSFLTNKTSSSEVRNKKNEKELNFKNGRKVRRERSQSKGKMNMSKDITKEAIIKEDMREGTSQMNKTSLIIKDNMIKKVRASRRLTASCLF